MKFKFRRILAALPVIVLILSLLISCGDDKPVYSDMVYEENGLRFVLPANMRRENAEGYDLYFSNLAIIFTAIELDEEFLESKGIPTDTDAAGYIDFCIERNGMDRDQIYYLYEEEQMRHSFRYTYSEPDSIDLFYYVVVIGEPGNLWYIEMCCDYEDSGELLSEFETWRKNIRTYEEG